MVLRISASAVGRASGTTGMSELIVCGSSASFCFDAPTARYAVKRPRAGVLNDPVPCTYCIVLLGQRAIRACAGPRPSLYALEYEGESVIFNGLSQIIASTLLLNHDPSQPMLTRASRLAHSSEAFASVVRWSIGAGSSMSLLNPNDAPYGIAPLRRVLVTLNFRSRSRFAV